MKFYSPLLFLSSLLTLSPIEHIIYGNSSETIQIKMNTEGITQFQFSYYKDDNQVDFYDDEKTYEVKKGDILEMNIDKKYPKVIIEVFTNDEYQGEITLNIEKISMGEDYEILITDKEIFENIDIQYTYSEDGEISEVKELRNHYVFKPLNKYLLPKIIEIDKLQIEIEEQYLNKGYTECYLLLNHGLKGSDFNKSEEDFYKVPLICNIKDNIMNFSLSEDYYYDFNNCVMKNKKSNNCVKVNDIILSKNDYLLTEGYLIIEKFGYYQKKLQLDLLIEEKPLFGKNGYYSIKKIN